MANFCANCGNPLKEGVKFCTNCGTPVAASNVNQQSEEKPFKPVFVGENVVQQPEAVQQTDTFQQPEVQYEQTNAQNVVTETNTDSYNGVEYNTGSTEPINVQQPTNVEVPVEKQKPYFGVKNIFLFLLNVAAIVTFFLGGLIVKVLPSTEFVGMEDGAEATMSFGKGFLYTLQTAFGFGKFNTGVELIDQALTDTSLLFKEGTDSVTSTMSFLTKVVGGIGVLFLVLAVLATIISLVKLIKRKRGRSSNVASIFSSAIGLLIGLTFIVIVLLLKDSILGSITVAEGYKFVPFDLSLDMYAYIFTGICLLLFIIAIITMKK